MLKGIYGEADKSNGRENKKVTDANWQKTMGASEDTLGAKAKKRNGAKAERSKGYQRLHYQKCILLTQTNEFA